MTTRTGFLTALLVLAAAGPASATDRIVFSSGADEEEGTAIFSIRPDGTHRRRVTQGAFDTAPAVSPQRRLVAYAHASARSAGARIYVIKPSGGTPVPVSPPGLDAGNPTWVSNKRILFDGESDGGRGIFSIKVDGTGLKTVVTGGDFDDSTDPDWSPDAQRMVYANDADEGVDELITAKLDGSDHQNITGLSRNGSQPAWAPQGKQIAYVGQGGFCFIHRDGTHRHCLDPAGLPKFFEHPAWAHDGKRIAFAGRKGAGKKPDIYTMRRDGSDLQRVTTFKGADQDPDW